MLWHKSLVIYNLGSIDGTERDSCHGFSLFYVMLLPYIEKIRHYKEAVTSSP